MPSRPDSFTPRRVLVREVNWLGDLVMSLPALRTIRAAYPAAQLTVLVKEDLAEFFAGMKWIDEVLIFRPSTRFRGWLRDWTTIRAIRARRFDLAVLFPNSFASALWMSLAGVPQRVGYATDGRSLLLTRHAAPAPDALSGHQSTYWLAMVRDTLGLAVPMETSTTSLEVSAVHLAAMREWLAVQRTDSTRPLIAIAPVAAYGPAKEWPADRYAALIDLLADRHRADCVIVGAAAEQARCDQIAAATRAGATVAAGRISLGELIALLSLCDGFVGNDSGAMHTAAAVVVPTVGVFGSTNPARTGPLGPHARFIHHPPPCSPCLQRTCRFGHYDCLHAIAPGEVAAMLAQAGAFT